jgi:mono/diheme cytochrome c family protein
MSKKLFSITLAVIGFSGAALAADKPPDVSKLPPAATKAGVTFDVDIKPIFEKHCFKCHGPEKQKSKYRVDSLEAAIKGGSSKEASVIPGQSAKSPLVHFVGYLVEEMEMPPTDDEGKPQKLADAEIGLIRAWIDQGAK